MGNQASSHLASVTGAIWVLHIQSSNLCAAQDSLVWFPIHKLELTHSQEALLGSIEVSHVDCTITSALHYLLTAVHRSISLNLVSALISLVSALIESLWNALSKLLFTSRSINLLFALVKADLASFHSSLILALHEWFIASSHRFAAMFNLLLTLLQSLSNLWIREALMSIPMALFGVSPLHAFLLSLKASLDTSVAHLTLMSTLEALMHLIHVESSHALLVCSLTCHHFSVKRLLALVTRLFASFHCWNRSEAMILLHVALADGSLLSWG